jgi:hypothetical protein
MMSSVKLVVCTSLTFNPEDLTFERQYEMKVMSV